MSKRDQHLHDQLLRDLAELKLRQIAATYQEVLDEAARQNASMLQVLSTLIASEITAGRQRALERRIRQAKLPPRKTLEDYDFEFPKRIPKAKLLRLFDCDFVAQHQCAVLIFPRDTGHRVKNHIMKSIQYEVLDEETAKDSQSGIQERGSGISR